MTTYDYVLISERRHGRDGYYVLATRWQRLEQWESERSDAAMLRVSVACQDKSSQAQSEAATPA